MDANHGSDRDRQLSPDSEQSWQYKVEPSLIRRGPWSPEEDHKLMEIISAYGPLNWVRISILLGSRSPKQCRERYHQNLKPLLNRNPITYEEGRLIEELVAKHGKKWAEIARHLTGRSDNAIKNWWNGGANKRRRASQVQQPQATGASVESSLLFVPEGLESSGLSKSSTTSREEGLVKGEADLSSSPCGVSSFASRAVNDGPEAVSTSPRSPGLGQEQQKKHFDQHHFLQSQPPGKAPSQRPSQSESQLHGQACGYSYQHQNLPHLRPPAFPGVALPHTVPHGLQGVLPYPPQAAHVVEHFTPGPVHEASSTTAIGRSTHIPYSSGPVLPQVAFNTTIFSEPARLAFPLPTAQPPLHFALGNRTYMLRLASIDHPPLSQTGTPGLHYIEDRRHSASLAPVVSTSPALYTSSQKAVPGYTSYKSADSLEHYSPYGNRSSSWGHHDASGRRSGAYSTSTAPSSRSLQTRAVGGELGRKRSLSLSRDSRGEKPTLADADSNEQDQALFVPPYKRSARSSDSSTMSSADTARQCNKSMSVSSLIN